MPRSSWRTAKRADYSGDIVFAVMEQKEVRHLRYPGDGAMMTMILEMANRGKNFNLSRKRVGWRWLWS
jgi:hypothetical protein